MGRIEVRDFDGDIAALGDMAYDTLLEERGDDNWLDYYRPEIARHLFADVPDPRFLIAAYDGSKLVAFVANLPRRYRLNGQTYLGVWSTMLGAHRDYRGAAVYLIAECLRRNQEFGADLAMLSIERRGYRSREMYNAYLRPRFPLVRVKPMYAITHAVDFDRIVQSQGLKWYERAGIRFWGAHRPITAPPVAGVVRPYAPADVDQILALLGRYSDRNSLVRVFTRESLARRLATPGVTATLVYERGGAVLGFINFTAHELVSRRGRHRWGWLDFLYWDGLSAGEQRALLAGVWQASRELSCIGILEWNKDYYDKRPLYRARFVPYPNYIEINAWVLNPRLSVRGVRSIVEQVV